MRARPTILLAILLAAPAAAEDADAFRQRLFCADLHRVVDAAQEEGGFARLERSRAAPPSLGFSGPCQATGDEQRRYWLCGEQFAPESKGVEALSARIAACLPNAKRAESRMPRESIFTLPGAEIRLSEHGGPRAHVGRVVELVIEAIPAE